MIMQVFVVGLAYDFAVSFTAKDAVSEGVSARLDLFVLWLARAADTVCRTSVCWLVVQVSMSTWSKMEPVALPTRVSSRKQRK